MDSAAPKKKYRKKIIAGNWKMNKSVADGTDLARLVCRDLDECREVDVVLCPPFTALKAVGEVLDHSLIKLGAQHMHWENDGAFTGEISAGMLRDLYCHYVIIGHSERRQYFNETNETVNLRVRSAQAANLIPIVCVGETLEQREADETEDVIRSQVEEGLQGVNGEDGGLIIAYEPVWAIGTGMTATPEQAQDVHAYIRSIYGVQFGEAAAAGLRIQYGGSVKPGNAAELLAQPDIDGGLIGGASLDARSFVEIVKAALPDNGAQAEDTVA